ncbi:hypothetical protein CPB86DRAFT_694901 [Serendipita vermifera]|nr:hypothetical protein CPB86DRAFT_694901 [Serendipita vermifera]
MTGQDTISFQESGGEALVAANRALFKSARPASERIHWGLNSAQDPSVQGLLDWVDQMAPELAMLAMHKFLNTQKRGALISNATYRPASTPDEPAFDWITFEQSRGTLDATFQEGIAKYDPLTTAIVYVFLLSPSGNSMGIWKRKLIIPPETQEMYRDQLAEVYAYVKRQPHVIAVER